MNVQPYLFFNGRCEEALDFYAQAVGAQREMLMRFDESPQPHTQPLPAGWGRKVMHAAVRIGDAMVLASDDMGEGAKFDGFGLALSVADAAEAQQRFAALSEGGRVTQPLGPTFFSPAFGMLADRFGVHWMVMANPAP
jgi:PhnB protein